MQEKTLCSVLSSRQRALLFEGHCRHYDCTIPPRQACARKMGRLKGSQARCWRLEKLATQLGGWRVVGDMGGNDPPSRREGGPSPGPSRPALWSPRHPKVGFPRLADWAVAQWKISTEERLAKTCLSTLAALDTAPRPTPPPPPVLRGTHLKALPPPGTLHHHTREERF